MSEKIIELKQDIKELECFVSQTTRQKVKDILSIDLRKLITEVAKLEEQLKVAEVTSTAKPSVLSNRCYEVKLTNYAWDQTQKFVKFYVTLTKVQNLEPENIFCNFTNKSLELHVNNLENKNYVLTINKLLYNINPEQSSWKVKSDMIIITAAKQESATWSHVTELEKKANDAKKVVPDQDKNADPSNGIMGIMRNMYEQGDDEMKRTIAKAWTESQQKGPAL